MKHIYIILFSLAFVACGNSEKNVEAIVETETVSNEINITKQQFEGENMAFGSLSEQEFNENVITNGMIDVPPHNKSSVTSFIGGYITKTPLLVGDKVKKEQLLVTLENPEFVEIQQNYLEVAEQLNYLKSEFTRQKTLYDENITSQKNFLKAESTYKSNLAHYNGLRKKLQMMSINPTSVEQGHITSTINLYAPIAGYITQVNVSNGTYVSPSDIVMEIVDTDHIHLELSVFEKDILNAADLAEGLAPLYGEFAKYFLGIGLFAAGITSAITAPLAAAYVAKGCLGLKGGLKSKRFRFVWMIILFLGVLFSSIGIKPIEIIKFAQIANGMLLPIIAGILLWIMNKKNVLGSFVNTKTQNILGFVILSISIFLGAKGILKVFGLL